MVRSGAVKTILRLFAVLLTALLALALVRQTAFAKTYVITDGDRVVTYTTFATDTQKPKKLLNLENPQKI